MTWYELFKWIHVTSITIWVGGAAAIQLFVLRMLRERDGVRLAGFTRDIEVIGRTVFAPTSGIALLSGVGLVLNGSWDWSEPFISLGLLALLASAGVGSGFLGPESGRISAIVERDGPDSAEAVRRRGRILLISRIELAILLVVIFLMVVKPGT
ncbi:MAG: DUF2269 family protein [Gaiellales bacterium]